jgi:hypothetical protein
MATVQDTLSTSAAIDTPFLCNISDFITKCCIPEEHICRPLVYRTDATINHFVPNYLFVQTEALICLQHRAESKKDLYSQETVNINIVTCDRLEYKIDLFD